MKHVQRMLSVGLLIVASASQVWADFGDPLPGLSAADLGRFQAGKATFAEVEEVADGLGPVFNESSCATCHTALGGNTTRLETRFGTTTLGMFDPLVNLGGSLRQDRGIGRGDTSSGLPNIPACAVPFSFVAEVVPPQASIVALRRTIPLFGLGLVDALQDATLITLAANQANNTPATAGTVSLVPDPDQPSAPERVGKFGWKAQNPTLHAFAGDAYVNEMGITNPAFPNENCPQGDCSILVCNPEPAVNDPTGADVTAFTDFMTLLAPPPRGNLPPQDKEGEQALSRIGCADCHTPTLTSGPNPVAALANQTFHPYSDFLLHDMGNLGDGIQQNHATGTLMRTAPLWGVRIQATLMHDGRATTLTDAILAHAGQGATASANFVGLNQTQKGRLLAFLGSL